MVSSKTLLPFIVCSVILAPARADGLRNGLPPTSTDSFVYESGPNAEMIYGDESIPIGCGTYALPNGLSPTPIAGFNKIDRVNSGIYGTRAAGLTTGHGSYMPDAAGRDEFLNGGPEFSLSGNAAAVTAQPSGFGFDLQISIPAAYAAYGATFNSTKPMYGIPVSGIPGAVATFPSFSQMFPGFNPVSVGVSTAVKAASTVARDASNVRRAVSDVSSDFGF